MTSLDWDSVGITTAAPSVDSAEESTVESAVDSVDVAGGATIP